MRFSCADDVLPTRAMGSLEIDAQVNGTFSCRSDQKKIGNVVLSDDWSNQLSTIFIIMLSVTLGLFSCCFMCAHTPPL